jgi:hypothetical protein
VDDASAQQRPTLLSTLIHSCTHARLHACMHALTHARTHAHARMHAHTHARTHAHTHARTHAHARMHALTCTHARTHACTHSRTRTHAHTRTHARTHARMHAHTHACTRIARTKMNAMDSPPWPTPCQSLLVLVKSQHRPSGIRSLHRCPVGRSRAVSADEHVAAQCCMSWRRGWCKRRDTLAVLSPRCSRSQNL